MEKSFDRLEYLLSEELFFLRPGFSTAMLCREAGGREEDFDDYLMRNFGITLRDMVLLYAETYFRGVLDGK
ncbi:hypothetical protein B5F83_05545 [Muribaculum sp. An289]|uniref:hypothetical protein n=1 Tax=unclassified Muribaculum TaxID=2622126 RepID=UPI000B36EB27|nr:MULTISPECIES: hypothetical protein [unclassified Muribaculum]OUO37223.1 hypothetical protein B5F83_05545 [Muribaculum sp. An289]OUO43134.1 hypothetical protein B5F81_05020 [Muribaculum sp. An287]